MLKRQRNWNSRNLDVSIKCYSESESCSVVSDFLRPHGLYSLRNSLGQNTRVGSQFPSPGDLPNLGIKPRSPALQVDSLSAEPQTLWKTD